MPYKLLWMKRCTIKFNQISNPYLVKSSTKLNSLYLLLWSWKKVIFGRQESKLWLINKNKYNRYLEIIYPAMKELPFLLFIFIIKKYSRIDHYGHFIFPKIMSTSLLLWISQKVHKMINCLCWLERYWKINKEEKMKRYLLRIIVMIKKQP